MNATLGATTAARNVASFKDLCSAIEEKGAGRLHEHTDKGHCVVFARTGTHSLFFGAPLVGFSMCYPTAFDEAQAIPAG